MKIDQDIADVLRASRFEGNRLVLQGQLDRKLYARVNDVIAAMGGAFEELPAGSFRASGTDVNAVVLTVRGGR